MPSRSPISAPVASALETPAGRIEYVLQRSTARRSIEIAILQPQTVRVLAPRFAAAAQIDNFIRLKSAWIVRQLKASHAYASAHPPREYQDGQEFLYLGQKYPLRIVHLNIRLGKIFFDSGKWTAAVPANLSHWAHQKLIKEKLENWYRQQAEEIFGGRVFHYSRVMGTTPLKITVRTQKRLWGSCHPHSKSINLNWLLVLAPREVIDCVIVHELAHLDVPNHSARFWRRVVSFMPDFKIHERWLKQNRQLMILP